MSNSAREALDLMRREPGAANTLRFLWQYSADTRRRRVPGAPGIMMMIHESGLRGRITINSAQCGGDPCIRGMRIRVSDVMDLLGDGRTPSEILREMPDLEAWDILAAIHYATGDYVEYRKILLRGVTVEDIFEEARRRQTRESMAMSIHAERITTDPAQYGGRPFIRGTGITLQDVLDLLASGYSDDDVLEELPELKRADVFAVMDSRAQQSGTP